MWLGVMAVLLSPEFIIAWIVANSKDVHLSDNINAVIELATISITGTTPPLKKTAHSITTHNCEENIVETQPQCNVCRGCGSYQHNSTTNRIWPGRIVKHLYWDAACLTTTHNCEKNIVKTQPQCNVCRGYGSYWHNSTANRIWPGRIGKHLYQGCPRGVMVKAMNCGIVVREFVLQSRYYVHFRANTLGKGMNPPYSPTSYG